MIQIKDSYDGIGEVTKRREDCKNRETERRGDTWNEETRE